MNWREIAAPIIYKTLAKYPNAEHHEIRRALRLAYPFGERKRYPYKAWLKEIHALYGYLNRRTGRPSLAVQLRLPFGDGEV